MLAFTAPLLQGVNKQMQAEMERQARANVEAAEDAQADEAGNDVKAQTDHAGGDVSPNPAAGENVNAGEGQQPAGKQPGPPLGPMVMPVMPDMGEIFKIYNNPHFTGFGLADAVSGMVLNLLLLISGAGLLMLRPWGRTLAVWTAWLKIARLVALYLFAVFVTVPVISKLVGNMAEKMIAEQAAGRGAPPVGTLTMVYAVMGTVLAVGMILIGVIYPAISLWLLNKPASKAACRAAPPAAA